MAHSVLNSSTEGEQQSAEGEEQSNVISKSCNNSKPYCRTGSALVILVFAVSSGCADSAQNEFMDVSPSVTCEVDGKTYLPGKRFHYPVDAIAAHAPTPEINRLYWRRLSRGLYT